MARQSPRSPSPSAPRVLLTIDTAPRWRAGDDRSRWEDAVERCHEGAGVGLRHQLRMLARHALKACFFVDPASVNRFGSEPLRRLIEPVLAAGQEVQLALRVTAGQDEAAQRALIARARDFLVEAGAPDPIAFRAIGAATDATLRALAGLGFRFDSSHGREGAIGLPPDQIAPVERFGVVEIPVTRLAEGSGSADPGIAALPVAAIAAAIEQAGVSGLPLVTLASDGAALADSSGAAPDKIRVERFEALCAWLSDERRACPTSFFADLSDLPLDVRSTMPEPGFSRVGRMIGQLWPMRSQHERDLL